MKRLERRGIFVARDAAGAEYTIYVWQEVIEVRTRGGTQRIDGMKTLKLADGRHVNKLEAEGCYEIVFPPIQLTSDDPARS